MQSAVHCSASSLLRGHAAGTPAERRCYGTGKLVTVLMRRCAWLWQLSRERRLAEAKGRVPVAGDGARGCRWSANRARRHRRRSRWIRHHRFEAVACTIAVRVVSLARHHWHDVDGRSACVMCGMPHVPCVPDSNQLYGWGSGISSQPKLIANNVKLVVAQAYGANMLFQRAGRPSVAYVTSQYNTVLW